MAVRGVRGATTIEVDEPQSVRSATQELVGVILEANPSMALEDIASIIFTVTEDIQSEYPAYGARLMGFIHVPMICAREIPVPRGLPLCIRVLIHWNTGLVQSEVHHVYLKGAAGLRPDLNSKEA